MPDARAARQPLWRGIASHSPAACEEIRAALALGWRLLRYGTAVRRCRSLVICLLGGAHVCIGGAFSDGPEQRKQQLSLCRRVGGVSD